MVKWSSIWHRLFLVTFIFACRLSEVILAHHVIIIDLLEVIFNKYRHTTKFLL